MIDEKTKKIIENNPVAFSTVCEGNKPNVIAVAYVKIKDDKIIITDNYMKQTKENLEKNNDVCLAAWNKDWNGYKIIGTAQYFNSGKWFDFVKSLEENKDEPSKGAIVITPIEIKKLG